MGHAMQSLERKGEEPYIEPSYVYNIYTIYIYIYSKSQKSSKTRFPLRAGQVPLSCWGTETGRWRSARQLWTVNEPGQWPEGESF